MPTGGSETAADRTLGGLIKDNQQTASQLNRRQKRSRCAGPLQIALRRLSRRRNADCRHPRSGRSISSGSNGGAAQNGCLSERPRRPAEWRDFSVDSDFGCRFSRSVLWWCYFPEAARAAGSKASMNCGTARLEARKAASPPAAEAGTRMPEAERKAARNMDSLASP
jgi:hypothetical protein